MTHHDWLTSDNPATMLREVTETFPSHRAQMTPYASARKLRLFAVACCRAVWDRLVDPRSRRAVEVAERYADGLATGEQLSDAWEWSTEACIRSMELSNAYGLADVVRVACIRGSRVLGLHVGRWDDLDPILSPATQAAILRTIIGDPFNPVTLNPHCRTPDVLAIATRIYDTRDWDAMPMLADALETSGCEDTRVLEWLRGETDCGACGGDGIYIPAENEDPAVVGTGCKACSGTGRIKPVRCRGDWVVDLVLGKA